MVKFTALELERELEKTGFWYQFFFFSGLKVQDYFKIFPGLAERLEYGAQWDGALIFLLIAEPTKRGLFGRYWGIDRKVEKYAPSSYENRIGPLRDTTSGQLLRNTYRAFIEALPHKEFTQAEINRFRQLVYTLWVDAHREAGLLQDSAPYLDVLEQNLRECGLQLERRLEAEREIEASLAQAKLVR